MNNNNNTPAWVRLGMTHSEWLEAIHNGAIAPPCNIIIDRSDVE